jgi:hypothetical protein
MTRRVWRPPDKKTAGPTAKSDPAATYATNNRHHAAAGVSKHMAPGRREGGLTPGGV